MKKHPLIRPAIAQPAVGPVQQFFTQRFGPLFERQAIDLATLPAVIRQVLERPLSFYEELAKSKPAAADKPLTNVAFILDVSDSMETGKGATIEGFNEQVKVVRKGAEGAGETTFTEVQFSDTVQVRRVASSLDTLVPLSDESYVPDGMTALYDALGDTIAALLQTPRMDSPATATLVTLFTDGGENSSSRYDAQVLSELVKRLEATGRWTFALVGPRGSVDTLADTLSVKRGNVAGYNPESVADRKTVFGKVGTASASFMSMRSVGATQACALYSSQEDGQA